MNTTEILKSTWKRSTTRRFLRWISSWRVLRVFLFLITLLTTLVFLFYGIENWRGKRAWEKYRSAAETQGEALDWRSYVPPPVPDDENFAMTPFLAPLFDFVPDPQPGESPWRDTNGFERAQSFAKDLPGSSGNGNWRLGEKTDLAAWLKDLNKKKAKWNAGGSSSKDVAANATSEEVASIILKTLHDFEPVIDELKSASQRPKARFPLRYGRDNPAGILLPHLAVMKRACDLMKIRALASLASGKSDAAFEDMLLILHLGEAHQGEPFIISQLVRIADFQMAIQVLWEGLADHRFKDSQLAEMQRRLSRLNFLQDMDYSMRAERAFGIKTIDWVLLAAHSGRALDRLGWEDGSGGSSEAPYWLEFFPRGWFYYEKLNYSRLFGEYLLLENKKELKTIDPNRVQTQSDELENIFNDKTPIKLAAHHLILSRMLLPALSNIYLKPAFAQNAAREGAMACALERYRIANDVYPENADELMPRFLETLPRDVITGSPLKYRRVAPDRFVLYSIGWNRKDDGGRFGNEASQVKSSKSRGFDLKEGDWTWNTF